MSAFVPRTVFPALDSLPRSYYLGHHAAGLSKMRTMLSQLDLIIECRDSRIPLTSRNPMFEDALAGKERLIVYTKRDMIVEENNHKEDANKKALLRALHAPSSVIFSDHKNALDVRKILSFVRERHQSRGGVIGSHLMVVGMPNVGKSSLLNALRHHGIGKGKAAQTGAQPGVTRKIGTSVKIMEDIQGDTGGVYLLDSPGVFIPYVPDNDAMLKLALCGSVKDNIIPPFTLADYLLYHVNLQCADVYRNYHEPTNDILQLLEAIAQKTGRLQKGGTCDLESTALWMVQRWRTGHLGRFMLDHVDRESLHEHKTNALDAPVSISQARKAGKEALRAQTRARRSQAE